MKNIFKDECKPLLNTRYFFRIAKFLILTFLNIISQPAICTRNLLSAHILIALNFFAENLKQFSDKKWYLVLIFFCVYELFHD